MVHTMKTVAGITGAPRRQHEKSFKAELVEQCLAPGASVAAVALAGGINANLLFKWRRDHLRSQRLISAVSSSSAVLVPVHVASAVDDDAGNSQSSAASPASTSLAVAPQRSVRTTGIIELDIAGAQLRLRGPVDEASLCSVLRALRHST
ncbi:MAG: transposase [Chitinophagaceae bacterium]|nr:transposase [Rubrivivax sp.]